VDALWHIQLIVSSHSTNFILIKSLAYLRKVSYTKSMDTKKVRNFLFGFIISIAIIIILSGVSMAMYYIISIL